MADAVVEQLQAELDLINHQREGLLDEDGASALYGRVQDGFAEIEDAYDLLEEDDQLEDDERQRLFDELDRIGNELDDIAVTFEQNFPHLAAPEEEDVATAASAGATPPPGATPSPLAPAASTPAPAPAPAPTRLRVVADYAGEGPPELPVIAGQLLELLEVDQGNGWTYVTTQEGRAGYAPTSYLEFLDGMPGDRQSIMPAPKAARMSMVGRSAPQLDTTVAAQPHRSPSPSTGSEGSIATGPPPPVAKSGETAVRMAQEPPPSAAPLNPRAPARASAPPADAAARLLTPGTANTPNTVFFPASETSRPSTRTAMARLAAAAADNDGASEGLSERDRASLVARSQRKSRLSVAVSSVAQDMDAGMQHVPEALARAGFRPSLSAEARTHTDPLALLGLQTDDLGFDYTHFAWDDQGQLIPAPVALSKTLKIQDAKHIPVPPLARGVTIEERVVLLSLFDGESFQSNVAQCRAAWSEKKPTTWKWTSSSDLPGSSEADSIFIMCNGWALLPLYESSRAVAANKTYTLTLQGGTPLERGVQLGNERKPPTIVVKLSGINKSAQELCDSIPCPIMTQLSNVTFLSLYRNALVTRIVHHPEIKNEGMQAILLSSLPALLDDPLMMNMFKRVWDTSLKLLKKDKKRDPLYLTSWFELTFTQNIWPLLHVENVQAPYPVLAGHGMQREYERKREAWLRHMLQSDNLADMLCDYSNGHEDTHAHEAFDIAEVYYRACPAT
ncbi:uncharacterized protein MONBRDRAFT_31083 [Monosiga brevicollis MX1]|uniref:SH3 domain-containing protein n=1 Tax=Monosiga brevicollis TaxID=81824 RepID=A9UNL8_MONBE|nr:uncharacterized protein MONBRDRAFT_31083 [Monosiga brevicollis MX1]EDQ93157.1 predicted protein [Monosiga brevicollis MX1]|eukprot:XP_001742919.1 hypothetical protein [Monosiga brevicollis MX1]